MPIYHALEKIIRRAPLALRFTDMVTGKQVTSGLEVVAWREDTTYPYHIAQPSQQSGIYGYPNLPEYRKFEPEDGSGAAIPPVNYVLYMRDRLGRFLPQTISLTIPQSEVQDILLFSQAARPTPAGRAILRGEAWDSTNNRAASWAVIQAEITGVNDTYTTIADARGMFVLYVPYPAPPNNGNLLDVTWDVTISVLYDPVQHTTLAGYRPDKPPTMGSLLAQSGANVEDSTGDGGQASIVRELQYQQPLIVRSDGVDESRLNVV